jgi:hypothetical protein
LCLLFLFWVALAIYVEAKKDSLVERARVEIRNRIGGDLHTGHVDISLFRHFPAATLQLTDVSLRDSAWQRHHHDLFTASNVFVSCSLFRSLFKGKLELGTVFIDHGALYFYTDSTGYSNTYLLKSHADSSRPDAREKAADLPRFVCSDVRWTVDMQNRHKLFDLAFSRLDAVIHREDRTLRVDVNTALTTKSFAFNLEKGSFVREKALSGHFAFTYNTASKIIQIDKAKLSIDGHPFVFSGRFFPSVKPDPFFMTIDAEQIGYRQATGLLTPRLQEKLDQYDIDKPLSVHVQLDAGAADQHEPQILVRLNVGKANVLTPSGRFTDVSFLGFFTNEWVRGRLRGDENSGMRFMGFAGQLDSIPLHADTIEITDLKHPQLSCGLRSQFDLSAFNDLYGSEMLQFKKGHCRMDLRYKGPLSEDDTAGATVNGRLDIDSGAIVYLPYKFQLSNATGRLLFRDQDLIIERLDAHAGNTQVRIKGIAKNLIALIDHNSENVSMDWMLSASHLALEDFIALAGKSSSAAGRRSARSVFATTASRVDHFLKDGKIHLGIDAADISYENFSGAHARADLVFQDGAIRLTRLAVEQSSGSLEMTATLERHSGSAGGNPLTLESHLDQVDLTKLFRSFDNFGLKALTADNLKGRINADIRMTGLLTDKAQLAPNSLKGRIDFSITDGQLLDFEPMEKIHETVLKKRDLSEIRFASLQNEVDIDSTTMTIHRMEIRSTAFTVYAEGTYDLKKGTDMSLQVPLSNLKTPAADVPPESRGNDSKGGISLHLRAKTGDDGKLKISWDPFRKGGKKKKQADHRSGGR